MGEGPGSFSKRGPGAVPPLARRLSQGENEPRMAVDPKHVAYALETGLITDDEVDRFLGAPPAITASFPPPSLDDRATIAGTPPGVTP